MHEYNRRLFAFQVWHTKLRPMFESVDKFDFFVIPAKAGIQRSGVNAVRLDSGFRRNDGVLTISEQVYSTVLTISGKSS